MLECKLDIPIHDPDLSFDECKQWTTDMTSPKTAPSSPVHSAAKLSGGISKPKRSARSKEEKRISWAPSEDSRLIHAISLYGTRWTMIQQFLSPRSRTQCRERYRTLGRMGRILPAQGPQNSGVQEPVFLPKDCSMISASHSPNSNSLLVATPVGLHAEFSDSSSSSVELRQMQALPAPPQLAQPPQPPHQPLHTSKPCLPSTLFEPIDISIIRPPLSCFLDSR